MKKKIYAVSIFVLLVCILIAPFLIKVTVVCKSQFGSCSPELVNKLNKFNGHSLASAESSSQKVLKSDFAISDYSTQYKLPDTLFVNIIAKKPEFALYDPSTSRFALIDPSGIVIDISDNSTLPRVVVGTSLPSLGQKVTGETLTSLKLMGGVFEMYQVISGEIQDGSLVVELPGQIKVIFPLTGDSRISLGALSLIYSKITSGDLAGKYTEVDLRFKNPVLR